MKALIGASVIVLAAISGPAAGGAPNWLDAQAELDATATSIAATGSPAAIATHVAALERALADARAAIAAAKSDDGSVIVFVDGSPEKDALIASATSANPGRNVVAKTNPYPRIALFLGSYYRAAGKLEDAARVMAAGVMIDGLDGYYGRTSRDLIEQRAGILVELKRYPEALAAYEQGAALPGIPNYLKGAMLRGRGAVLVAMGRLEEAEAAYRESLAVMPGNPIAAKGLEQVLKLHAPVSGGPPKTD